MFLGESYPVQSPIDCVSCCAFPLKPHTLLDLESNQLLHYTDVQRSIVSLNGFFRINLRPSLAAARGLLLSPEDFRSFWPTARVNIDLLYMLESWALEPVVNPFSLSAWAQQSHTSHQCHFPRFARLITGIKHLWEAFITMNIVIDIFLSNPINHRLTSRSSESITSGEVAMISLRCVEQTGPSATGAGSSWAQTAPRVSHMFRTDR